MPKYLSDASFCNSLPSEKAFAEQLEKVVSIKFVKL